MADAPKNTNILHQSLESAVPSLEIGGGEEGIEMQTSENSNFMLDWNNVVSKRKRQTENKNVNNENSNSAKRVSRDPRLALGSLNTSNKFSVLADKEKIIEEDTSPESHNKSRPPPIHLHNDVQFHNLIDFLQRITHKDSFHCGSTKTGVTIYPHTVDAYRKIVRCLKENQAEFHTYQLSEDKAYRVVIRGLHWSIGEEAIRTEISNLGYRVRNVTNVISRDKIKLPLFYVDLEPCKNNNKIFDIKFLCYSRIWVEEPRQRRQPVQCVRCQRYNHTKNHCNLPPRCVKCGANHESSACTKPKDEPAVCCLCSGSHPSSYKGCSVFRDLQNRKSPVTSTLTQQNKQSQQQQSPPPTQQLFPSLPKSTAPSGENIQQQHQTRNRPFINPHRQPTMTYSQIAARKVEQEEFQSQFNMESQLTTFMTDLKALFTPMITLMSQLIQSLTLAFNGK
jgi:hypothetical protein